MLVVSAHWIYSSSQSAPASGRKLARLRRFPRELYALRYDAAGSPELAARVKALVEAAHIQGAGFVGFDEERPLDHGAWMPMRHFFPDADIPVVQLALNPHLPPATQIEIGRALAPLRAQGVLVLASGSFTNLREVFGGGRRAQHGVATEPYVDAFPANWLTDALDEALATGDTRRIEDYRAQAPHARRLRTRPTSICCRSMWRSVRRWGRAKPAAGAEAPAGCSRVVADSRCRTGCWPWTPSCSTWPPRGAARGAPEIARLRPRRAIHLRAEQAAPRRRGRPLQRDPAHGQRHHGRPGAQARADARRRRCSTGPGSGPRPAKRATRADRLRPAPRSGRRGAATKSVGTVLAAPNPIRPEPDQRGRRHRRGQRQRDRRQSAGDHALAVGVPRFAPARAGEECAAKAPAEAIRRENAA
ncbi:DODA-type extradiol aromatic ring-opening family dioxygenase [Cupriavidus basilensis]